ncbi:hypothetical protein QNH39_26840 [Neobacillus novalis]|uniref:Uncharacterized protein n=1 Tax=Neobacillus novalis TaxID=220687 RepID=A0AA95S8R1_9BACI|nr:hypothetical protein [Neobacillus novalis]WHY86145.1 hypothetical protein QNH39_26840 [Neobacillus novalis]
MLQPGYGVPPFSPAKTLFDRFNIGKYVSINSSSVSFEKFTSTAVASGADS